MLGAMLAEHALDSAYTPSLNPDAYGQDPNGNIVDKSGRIVPLYSQPNFIQKLVSPTAQRFAGLNAEQSATGLIANRDAAITKNLWLQRNASNPYLNKTIASDPNSAYSQYGTSNDWNAQTAEPILDSRARIQAGVPAVAGNAALQQAGATGAINENAWKKASTLGALGTPISEANTEDLGTTLQGNRNAYQLAGLPQEVTNYGLNQANTGTKLLGEQARLPYQEDTDLTLAKGQNAAAPYVANSGINQSILGSLADQQRLDLSQYTLGANRVNTLRESALAPYGGQANMMGMGTVITDPETGETKIGSNPFSVMNMNGQAHAPVPGLPGAYAPVSGAMPVSVGSNASDMSGPRAYNGSSMLNPNSLIPVDNLHAADSSGQIYYNQGTPQRPQYIPIQTASSDLQQKAIDAIHGVKDRQLKKNKLLGQLQELQHDEDKNTTGSQFLPALGREAALLSAPVTVPAIVAGHAGMAGLRGAGHLIGRASGSVMDSLGYQ